MTRRRITAVAAAVAIAVLLGLAGRSLAGQGSAPDLGPPIVVDRGVPSPTGSPSPSPSATLPPAPTPSVSLPGASPVQPPPPPPAGDDDGGDDRGDDRDTDDDDDDRGDDDDG